MALIKGHAELGNFSLRSAHQHFMAIINDIMFYYKNTLHRAVKTNLKGITYTKYFTFHNREF